MIVSLKKYMVAFAAVTLIAVAVSACGGDGPMTGADPLPPDDGDALPPDDGDPMSPEDSMATEYGDGLFASPETSPHAMSAADTILSITDNETTLAPVTAAIGMEIISSGNVQIMPLGEGNSVYIESATVADDQGQGTYTLVYAVDGHRTEVEFRPSDWTGLDRARTVDGVRYYSWSALPLANVSAQQVTGPNIPNHHWILGWQAGGDYRGYMANGIVTPPDRLTRLGSATYEGQMGAEDWRGDITSGNLGIIWGDITLEADLSEGGISGEVGNLWIQDHGEAYTDAWVQLADTNSIQISDGEIAVNRFHAEWQGKDTNSSSNLEYSMRGFDGSILGEFYGPNGEETGGVLTGQRDETNQMIIGRFGGTRQ